MPADANRQAPQPGHTYVIDRSYRVVYMDRASRRVFPGGRIGALCYECFRGASEPCHDCPWQADTHASVNQTVIYSERLDQWYEITCVELEWLDEGPCVLFSGRSVDDSSRSLFTTLSEPSSYDELFEINVTGNAYKVLYSEPDKYVMPPSAGALDVMFADVLEHMIHPEDRARFIEFWNFETLLERIEQSGGALRAEFRKLLTAGGWGWAAQTIVSVKRGEGGETVVMCFISDIDDEVREREARAQDAQMLLLKERDPLTGLYNASTFFGKAHEFVADNPSKRYEAVYLDIEHFKLFNEWYGREAGDEALQSVAESIARLTREGGVAGYLGGDDFALILPQGTATQDLIDEDLRRKPLASEDALGFQPLAGVCPVEGKGDAIVTACDHAMIAMNSVKSVYGKRIAWYEPSMSEEMEDETKTLLEVRQALKNREFVLHWQPQCSTRTSRIVGLEALVRWNHPERGLVMPGAFIPILERTGFIANLDRYVWEEACRHIRSWLDRGGTPLPVSVNISRADLYAIDVVDTIESLVNLYGIERGLLELEITESAYAEDERMTQAVNELKELGFTILMDDFGSGYSSLNMLKDITVDVIKIDMNFLNRQHNIQRGEGILETIVSMARLMDLRIIAEGAETADQVEFLKSIGCDYAQGYYFYRPMSTESLEELIQDQDVVDYRGVLSPMVDTIDVDALVHEDAMSRTIVDNLIGGMAVYAVYDDRYELMQVNNEYYHVTGCNPVDLKERQTCIWQQTHPEDRDAMLSLFDAAEQHPISGAEGTIRRYRLNGELMWLKLRVFFLSRQEDRRLFYAAVEDVTEQRQRELSIIGSVNSDARLFELLNAQSAHHWCFNVTRGSFLNAFDRELLGAKLDMRFVDWLDYDLRATIGAGVRPAGGYEAVAEFLNLDDMLARFAQGFSSRVMEYRRLSDPAERPDAPSSDACPPQNTAGAREGAAPQERWAELRYHLMRFDESDDVYAYLYVIDIDERKRRELRLADQAQRDSLTGLLNRQTASARIPDAFAATINDGKTGAFVIVDLDDFKNVNDGYGHLMGDRVLSGIGQHLKAAFRKQDLICRWGGDEFIVYCNDIGYDDIERRVRGLCTETWETEAGPGATVALTVSAGVAMVPEHGTRFTTVYERADAALYQAKSEGKAQFRLYETGMQPHITAHDRDEGETSRKNTSA